MKKGKKEVIEGGEVSPTATPIAYSGVERLIGEEASFPDKGRGGMMGTLGTMGTMEAMGTLGAGK